MPPNSTSEYLFFKLFGGGMPPIPLALACLAFWLCFAQYRYPVSMGSYIFPYIQNCPEILPDQCKIASSAPDIALNLASCYISHLSHMPHALFSYSTGGNDLTITYIYIYIHSNIGKSGLPCIYIQSPRAEGLYIRQTKSAHAC